MKKIEFIILAVTFFSIFKQFQSISSPLSFTANQKYSYIGKNIINIASQMQAANTTNWKSSPRSITISYLTSFIGINLYFYSTLGQFQSNNLANGVSIFISTLSVNSSYAMVSISTTSASIIQKLSISYLIYQNKNNYLNNFHFYLVKQNTLQYISSKSQNFTILYVEITQPTINITGGVSSIAMISGIQAKPADSKINTIDVSLTIVPMDYNTVQITLSSSNSSSFTYISGISILFCLYNPNYMLTQSSDYYRFYSGYIQGSNSSSMNYKSFYTTASFNTFVGLTAFSITNQTVFSFYQSVTPQTGIYITANNVFNSFSFSFLVIYSKYCQYKTPYYESITKLCYDICPSQSIADPNVNNNSLQCLCYINNTLTDNSNCVQSNYTQPITSPSTSSSVPMGMIIGLSIGIILSLALLVIVVYIIYKRIKSQKQEQNDNAVQNYGQNSSPISSNMLKSKNSLSLSKKNSIEIDFLRSTTSKNRFNYAQFKKSNFEINKQEQNEVDERYKDYEQKMVSWLEQEEVFQPLCYACNKLQAYLKVSCFHSFHYNCLIDKLKENNCCPECQQAVQMKASYYCNKCSQKYRIVQLSSLRIHKGFSIICDTCKLTQ